MRSVREAKLWILRDLFAKDQAAVDKISSIISNLMAVISGAIVTNPETRSGDRPA
jgi:hypothetical protein